MKGADLLWKKLWLRNIYVSVSLLLLPPPPLTVLNHSYAQPHRRQEDVLSSVQRTERLIFGEELALSATVGPSSHPISE